jgi:serine/threonine protein kinase
MKAIHQEGVVHMDARRENILLNPETQGVVIIDFERSRLLSPPRRQLAALEPNKRQRIQDTRGRSRRYFVLAVLRASWSQVSYMILQD